MSSQPDVKALLTTLLERQYSNAVNTNRQSTSIERRKRNVSSSAQHFSRNRALTASEPNEK